MLWSHLGHNQLAMVCRSRHHMWLTAVFRAASVNTGFPTSYHHSAIFKIRFRLATMWLTSSPFCTYFSLVLHWKKCEKCVHGSLTVVRPEVWLIPGLNKAGKYQVYLQTDLTVFCFVFFKLGVSGSRHLNTSYTKSTLFLCNCWHHSTRFFCTVSALTDRFFNLRKIPQHLTSLLLGRATFLENNAKSLNT